MGLSSYSILTPEQRGGGPDHQRVGTAWSKGVARPEILVSGTSDRGFKSHPPHQHRTVRPYLVRNAKASMGSNLTRKITVNMYMTLDGYVEFPKYPGLTFDQRNPVRGSPTCGSTDMLRWIRSCTVGGPTRDTWQSTLN